LIRRGSAVDQGEIVEEEEEEDEDEEGKWCDVECGKEREGEA